MGSSDCRRATDRLLAAAALTLIGFGAAGCRGPAAVPAVAASEDVAVSTSSAAPASRQAPASSQAPASLPPAGAPAFPTGIDLPEGPGRDLLLTACLECHDLGGLALFAGFYGRNDWRSLVLTMQGNGARISDDDAEIIADYLARHFGR